VNENRNHVALFEQQVLSVDVSLGNYIDIKLGG
jgi:hypothetical protein